MNQPLENLMDQLRQITVLSVTPEMSKNPAVMDPLLEQKKCEGTLRICAANQQVLDYFISHHGRQYRQLTLEFSPQVRDLSPLADLPDLELICLLDMRNKHLWNLRNNHSLRTMMILDSKGLSYRPELIDTSRTLEHVVFRAPFLQTYKMESLDPLACIPSLRTLSLHGIRPVHWDMHILDRMPHLEELHFDYNMLTTEEIAHICARYPRLAGVCLGAYERIGQFTVQFCGKRKPRITLGTPESRKAFDKYNQQFEELVKQFKMKLVSDSPL